PGSRDRGTPHPAPPWPSGVLPGQPRQADPWSQIGGSRWHRPRVASSGRPRPASTECPSDCGADRCFPRIGPCGRQGSIEVREARPLHHLNTPFPTFREFEQHIVSLLDVERFAHRDWDGDLSFGCHSCQRHAMMLLSDFLTFYFMLTKGLLQCRGTKVSAFVQSLGYRRVNSA